MIIIIMINKISGVFTEASREKKLKQDRGFPLIGSKEHIRSSTVITGFLSQKLIVFFQKHIIWKTRNSIMELYFVVFVLEVKKNQTVHLTLILKKRFLQWTI